MKPGISFILGAYQYFLNCVCQQLEKKQKLNKASGLIYKMSLRERGSNISQVKMTRLRSEVNVSLSDVSGASMNNRSMGRVLDFWMIARHQGFCSQSLKKKGVTLKNSEKKSQNYHAGTPIVQPQQARSVLL